ncbi:MAG: hypothetical protein R2774_04595 [Saprospiraceae bacterium]
MLCGKSVKAGDIEPSILAFTGFGTKHTFVFKLKHHVLDSCAHTSDLSDMLIDYFWI